jgi:hypothetical protein
MDITTMASVALQTAVIITQIGLIGFGIESAIIPGVGLTIAIVDIVMAILEWVIPHTPPSDPTENYINSEVETMTTMTKDLNVRPQALLTYEISQNIALNSNSAQI